MTAVARLVATFPAPLARPAADAPQVLCWPGRRLLVQRGDTEVVACALEEGAAVTRFPAPWPRRFGTYTVSPGRDLAVFAGVHALRAVDASGAVRWEIRHGCWEGSCLEAHASFDEYADDQGHRYADQGSAVFSADGSLVWAHVRGPLAPDALDPDVIDEWLVVDAADGRVLGQVDAQTVAAGSEHVPHPDPARMGLSVGEGQDGVPLLWGRWDREKLHAERIGEDDRVLAAVSPSGDRFLTVTHYQETLAVHRVEDGSVAAELDASVAVPRHPDAHPDDDEVEEETLWDYACGFLDEDTVIAGTTESDEEFGAGRHWLVDTARMRLTGRIAYPFPISGAPTPLGGGRWHTVSDTGDALHLWELRSGAGTADHG